MMNKFKKMYPALVIPLLLTLAVTGPCFSQTYGTDIHELVSRYHAVGKFNGCILVAKDGVVVYENALGVADPDSSEALTLNHGFRLASVSKQFTAMAVMMLTEEGKLSYEDTLTKFIPELPYRGVTVGQMLTHTSGLPDYSELLEEHWDTDNKGTVQRKVASNRDVLKLLVEHAPPMKFEPGTSNEYSNTGYMLLALVVENASGMRFQDFMKKNIFEPLGMEDTYVNPPDGVLPDSNRAKGISMGESGLVLNDHSFENGMYGDGGIISTVGDMLKWDQGLYAEKLVGKATLDEAFSPGSLKDGRTIDYGFGWSIIPTEGGKMVAHGGGWLGFRTFVLRDIPSRNYVVQLCNMPGITRGELVFAINGILHGGDYELPRKSIAELMMKEIRKNGLESAIVQYHGLKETARDEYSFAEGELNGLGYRLLQAGNVDGAIEIFKLNVEMFPEAFNVYDSLGEAYMIKGEKELAVANYEKSVELNPGNRNAQEKLIELRREE